jgi:hypothetical protein
MLFLQLRRQCFELFAHLHDWVSFWVMMGVGMLVMAVV